MTQIGDESFEKFVDHKNIQRLEYSAVLLVIGNPHVLETWKGKECGDSPVTRVYQRTDVSGDFIAEDCSFSGFSVVSSCVSYSLSFYCHF